MYKFFYHEDREDGINKLINILKYKKILNSEVTKENRDLINSMLLEIRRAKPNWKMFKEKQNVKYDFNEKGEAKLTPNNMFLANIAKKKKIIKMFNEMNIEEDVQNNFFEEIYPYDKNILSNDLTKEELLNILVKEGYVMVEFWYEEEGVEVGDE